MSNTTFSYPNFAFVTFPTILEIHYDQTLNTFKNNDLELHLNHVLAQIESNKAALFRYLRFFLTINCKIYIHILKIKDGYLNYKLTPTILYYPNPLLFPANQQL